MFVSFFPSQCDGQDACSLLTSVSLWTCTSKRFIISVPTWERCHNAKMHPKWMKLIENDDGWNELCISYIVIALKSSTYANRRVFAIQIAMRFDRFCICFCRLPRPLSVWLQCETAWTENEPHQIQINSILRSFLFVNVQSKTAISIWCAYNVAVLQHSRDSWCLAFQSCLPWWFFFTPLWLISSTVIIFTQESCHKKYWSKRHIVCFVSTAAPASADVIT